MLPYSKIAIRKNLEGFQIYYNWCAGKLCETNSAKLYSSGQEGKKYISREMY